MKTIKELKILLVDDHALFLQGFQFFLGVNGIQVIGTARSGPEALVKYEMLKPDLILMDLQMAQCDGIETTKMIKKEYPNAKIVMLTANEDKDSLFAAMQAGACGYLLKGMEPEQFLEQLSRLVQGKTPLAPGLAGVLLQEIARQKQTPAEMDTGSDRELTIRQLEILQLLTQGFTYKEMAIHLDLKEVTIKYHINEMLTKLHLDNRIQLIAYASQKGLINVYSSTCRGSHQIK